MSPTLPKSHERRSFWTRLLSGDASHRRQFAVDRTPQGQVLWTFFVAIAVAIAALQHVFGSHMGTLTELTSAARAPGSVASGAPQPLTQYQ